MCLQLDLESAAPPEQALRRKLNSHASLLKEFSITFTEAIKMVIFLYTIPYGTLPDANKAFECFVT